MFGFLKKIFGSDIPDTPVIAQPKVEPVQEKIVQSKTPAKKPAAKKAPAKKSVDLDSMKKDELLAHAKEAGVKVNASMKKADIITAIQNG